MTTAIFLLLMGSILEYSRNIDYYVFLVSISVSIFKIIYGIYMLTDDHFEKTNFADLNNDFPFELFYAICNSIKYI